MSNYLNYKKSLQNGDKVYRCSACGYSAILHNSQECPVCKKNDLLEKQTKIMSDQATASQQMTMGSPSAFHEAIATFFIIAVLEVVTAVGLSCLLPDSWPINISFFLGTGLVLVGAWIKNFGKWIATSLFALLIIGQIGNLFSSGADSKQSATQSRAELSNQVHAEIEKRRECDNTAPANWDDECRKLNFR